VDAFFKFLIRPNTIVSIALVIAAVVVWQLVRVMYKRHTAAGKAKGERATLMRVLFGVLRFLIVAGTLLMVLQINGVNVTSAVAGLGLLSAIVGLAIQDILKDVIMGIHIMTDHFFSVGDVIRYGDIEGVVTGFTMKSTTVRSTFDGTITTICNRNISQITKLPPSLMVDIDLPLSYDEDFRKVNVVLQAACDKIGKLEGIDRSIYKGTQEFAPSAIVYKLRFYCPPETKYDRTREAIQLLQRELDAADIHIPYNQLDVHTVA